LRQSQKLNKTLTPITDKTALSFATRDLLLIQQNKFCCLKLRYLNAIADKEKHKHNINVDVNKGNSAELLIFSS